MSQYNQDVGFDPSVLATDQKLLGDNLSAISPSNLMKMKGGSTRDLLAKPNKLHLMLNVMKPGKKHSGNLLKGNILEKIGDPSGGLSPRLRQVDEELSNGSFAYQPGIKEQSARRNSH
jgi:hypothetical protein